jgi:hypothetical protein
MTDNSGGQGSDGHGKGLSINLAAPRTLRIAANETGLVAGNEAFGITLCGFGVAFAGFAVGLRGLDSTSFDLPIMLSIFGFGAVLIIVGVVAAILRREGRIPAQSTELIALNSRPIAHLSRSLNIVNYQVLNSLRDAASISDFTARLDEIHGNGQGDSREVLRNDPDLLPELDLIRIALERSPLTILS